MKLLHLVDVTRNFVHGLHCNWVRQNNHHLKIRITIFSSILITYSSIGLGHGWYCTIECYITKCTEIKKVLAYRPGGSVPHCQGQWDNRAPLAAAGTSRPSEWVLSGTTPEWTNVAVWGFSQPGKPWNLGQFLLEEQKIRAFTHTMGQGNTDTDTDNCI